MLATFLLISARVDKIFNKLHSESFFVFGKSSEAVREKGWQTFKASAVYNHRKVDVICQASQNRLKKSGIVRVRSFNCSQLELIISPLRVFVKRHVNQEALLQFETAGAVELCNWNSIFVLNYRIVIEIFN